MALRDAPVEGNEVEGRALMNGISTLIKEIPENSVPTSTMRGCNERTA